MSNCGGFVGLLTLVFVVMKLMNYIDWSWWWVFSPLIIVWSIGIAIIILAYLYLGQEEFIRAWNNRK